MCVPRVSTGIPSLNWANPFPTARMGTAPCGACDQPMLTALWSGLGDKAAERWASLLRSPALAFWLVGALAWAWAHGWLFGSAAEWGRLLHGWDQQVGRAGVVAQIALLLVLLLVVSASARL